MVTHLYDNNSRVYNFLFHPLHAKEKDARVVSVITTIFLTIVTGGLWQIPFWVINRLDHQKLKKVNARLPNNVTVSTITLSRKRFSAAKSTEGSSADKVVKKEAGVGSKVKNDAVCQTVVHISNTQRVEVPLRNDEKKHPVTSAIDEFGTPYVAIDLTDHLKLGNPTLSN